MPAPGTLIDPPDDVAEYLLSIDVAERYETKIVEPPQEIKKKSKPSASSQAAPVPRTRTRRKSKKSVKKS